MINTNKMKNYPITILLTFVLAIGSVIGTPATVFADTTDNDYEEYLEAYEYTSDYEYLEDAHLEIYEYYIQDDLSFEEYEEVSELELLKSEVLSRTLGEALGVQNFEDIDYPSDEMIEISVQFRTPSSVALRLLLQDDMFYDLGIEDDDLEEYFVDMALQAHVAFFQQLEYYIGEYQHVDVLNEHHKLFNGVFLSVPAYMINSIASFPEVFAVFPNVTVYAADIDDSYNDEEPTFLDITYEYNLLQGYTGAYVLVALQDLNIVDDIFAIAPDVEIIDFRVFDDYGLASASDFVNATEEAHAAHADIITIPLFENWPPANDLLSLAKFDGTVVVATVDEAGVAALLIQAYPYDNPYEIKARFTNLLAFDELSATDLTLYYEAYNNDNDETYDNNDEAYDDSDETYDDSDEAYDNGYEESFSDDTYEPTNIQDNFTRFTVDNTDSTEPFIDARYDRTMVSLETLIQVFENVLIVWQAETDSVLISSNPSTTLYVDTSLPNGMGAPMIEDDTVFVPLRYVAELLGASVRWDADSRAVYVYQ